MNKYKKCFKCNKIKLLSSYYKHPRTKDRFLNKCKKCAKIDTFLARRNPKFREKILQYDKERAKNPERKRKKMLLLKIRREKYKGKAKANNALNNAIRDKKIKRLPCVECGNPKSEGHHTDYRKKLQVIWLCNYHHRKIHNRAIF